MTAGERPARRSRVLPLAAAGLLVVLLVALGFGVTGALSVSLPVALVAATGAIAVWAAIRQRAERDRHDVALTEWAAARAVLSERLEIARDLHDIVSHGLGTVSVRAATARYLDARGGSRSDLVEALDDIEAASREATVELRRMLGVLRRTDDPAPRLPTGSLASLPDLIAGAARQGVTVKYQSDELGRVSPGVQLAINCIVQEGLANTMRHCGPTSARLRLSRCGAVITVLLTDAGPVAGWSAAPGAGHGLLGLRERVDGLGGTLTAGPQGTGFVLEASLPDERRQP